MLWRACGWVNHRFLREAGDAVQVAPYAHAQPKRRVRIRLRLGDETSNGFEAKRYGVTRDGLFRVGIPWASLS